MSDKGKRLGRGLAALIADVDHEGSEDRTHVRSIALDALIPGPFQPRQDMSEDGIEDLASSIRAHGLLQPILVRPDREDAERFQIIAGERRWRASRLAGLGTVSVIVRALDDREAMAAGLIENLQRVDLNAIEEADGFRRLMAEFDFTQETLSRSIGKSRSHIANTVRLLALPVAVQSDVRRGALSAGHARALLGHADPARVARQVIARGLSVRQTEALARPADRITAPRGVPARVDPDIAALEKALTAQLGLSARVTFDGKGGQLVLRYSTLDQLDGLTRLLMPDKHQ